MLEPLSSSQWNETTAAHLLNRAGFGGSPQDIENIRRVGVDHAVSWFIDYDKIADDTPAPDWAHPDPEAIAAREMINKTADPEMKRMLQQERNRTENSQIAGLRYWWLRRMALGSRPLQEKMTLFWHNHFATSFEKVKMPYFLWLQNETLRQNAMGSFHLLLIAIAKDPAMLRYLDGADSNKNKPNENFAREVMELFTLGEGHYTEQDVQQAAKAYTGWGLSRDKLHYEYHTGNHDIGPKTLFGQTGNYTGEEALNIICAQPQCARFITAKLWRFFVQDQPPQPVIDELATQFHDQNMDIKALMRTIFRSREFYAPDVVRSQVKSPVQWLISSMHQLQTALPPEPMSLVMLLQLGQNLFQPPNVKGWDGGIAWITTNSLLDRYNFAAALVEGERIPLPNLRGSMKGVMNNIGKDGLMQIVPTNVAALFTPEQLGSPDAFLTALQARFLNGTLKARRIASMHDFLSKIKSPIEEADIRKAIRLMMSTPEYQLT